MDEEMLKQEDRGEQLEIDGQETQQEKKAIPVKLIIALAILLLTIMSCFISYKYVTDNANSKSKLVDVKVDKSKEKAISINIPLGSGTSEIAKILEDKGIIHHPTIFRMISYINGYDGTYLSGVHILNKDLSYDEIMRVLGESPETIKVRIPEYYTFNQLVKLLKSKELIDETRFRELVQKADFKYSFIKDIPKRENKLEGYLFPDTYYFGANDNEEKIIGTMLNRFDQIFKKEYYARAKQLNMTVDQIIILASIIEREAKVDSERKRIAGVFYNRLNNNDVTLRKLQSCATIEYILLNKYGKVKQKLSDTDTLIESPYNTYLHEGLPPGPICSPSKKSIEAALYPENNDYIYFVVKGDKSGKHYFSKTYSEHLNAISVANSNN